MDHMCRYCGLDETIDLGLCHGCLCVGRGTIRLW